MAKKRGGGHMPTVNLALLVNYRVVHLVIFVVYIYRYNINSIFIGALVGSVVINQRFE